MHNESLTDTENLKEREKKCFGFIFFNLLCSPSTMRAGRGKYQVHEALWFQLTAPWSTYPYASSLLFGPAASDLTLQPENSLGLTSLFSTQAPPHPFLIKMFVCKMTWEFHSEPASV